MSLIKMKKLYVSEILPKKWLTKDNPKKLKILQKKKIDILNNNFISYHFITQRRN